MTSPDTAPARPARPGTVTVAVWLQLATVAVLLLLIGLVVFAAVRYDAQIDRAVRLVPDADPTEVSNERSGNLFMTLAVGVPVLLLAGWLAATALPLRRGSNTARILVFVAAGAQLLVCLVQGCSGALVIPIMLAAGTAGPGFDPSDGVPPEDWEQSKFLDTLYAQGDPSDTFFGLSGTAFLLVLALTATVLVLLLLPESGRWFRPQPAVPAGAPPLPFGYGPPPPGAAFPYGYGYPMPAAMPPPGYVLCPDPALHFAQPPTGPAAPTPDDPPPAGVDRSAPGSRTPDGPGKPPVDPTAGPLGG